MLGGNSLSHSCAERIRDQFFGHDSPLREHRIGMEPWLSDLLSGQTPLFIPRPVGNGQAVWYAIAPDARGLRALESQLVAFLGPTLSRYRGGPTLLDPKDAGDQTVEDCFDHVIKVEVLDGESNVRQATERLKLLRKLLLHRPQRTINPVRPGADILRDLEEAIRLKDYQLSDRLLHEARSSGHFDSKNLTFLEFLVLEITADWARVLDHPKLSAVLSQPRPSRVTQALLRAVYWSKLAPVEAATDAAQAVEHFREHVWPAYRGLFSTRVGTTGREAEVCFVLRAVAISPQQPELVLRLLDEVDAEAAYYPWLLALRQLLPPADSDEAIGAERSLEDAWSALRSFDVDSAWELGLRADTVPDRINLLGQCALNSNSIERTRFVLEMATQFPEQSEHPNLGRVLERLKERIQPDGFRDEEPLPPDGWGSWAKRLGESDPWSEAVVIADFGAEEWELLGLTKDPMKSEGFAADLEGASEVNVGFLRAAVPHLLRALERSPQTAPGLRRIYEALTFVVLTDDAPGYSYFGTLTDLAEKFIETGVTPAQYEDLVTDIDEKIAQDGSPSTMSELMDLLDLLLLVRCPNPALLSQIAATVLTKARNLDAPQLSLLRSLVVECGLDFPASLTQQLSELSSDVGEGMPSPLEHLAGKCIALYSLDEGSLRRVGGVLEESGHEIEVRLFSDHGGTRALRDAARNADVFVVATRTATHAATDFITANRPPERAKVIFPSGKGSSSMLSALLELGK